jgi:outer membrane protein assembly factor BamB
LRTRTAAILALILGIAAGAIAIRASRTGRRFLARQYPRDARPVAEAPLSVEWSDPARTWNGYTLVVPTSGNMILWAAMDGAIAKQLDTPWKTIHAEQLSTGTILVLTNNAIRELDPSGVVVWQYRGKGGLLHHEVRRTPRGSTLALLMTADQTRREWNDSVIEVNREGKVDWRWEAFRHFDPTRDRDPVSGEEVFLGGKDWLHANSIDLFPDGDLLVSLRNINRLVRVAYPSGEIVWSWGPGVLGHQHSARVLANGHIMVFDNGFRPSKDRECTRSPCASRALEVDPKTGQVVWSFEGDGLFSMGFGDAQRLPNGNTLITFGESLPEAVILEVTPEGNVVWRLKSNLKTKILGMQPRATLYRAQRVERLP